LPLAHLLAVLVIGVGLPLAWTQRHWRGHVTMIAGLWSRVTRRVSRTMALPQETPSRMLPTTRVITDDRTA
jgi:hypothetical protein